MRAHVNERDLNRAEILKRGGANGGDEDYAFVRCPFCSRLYLIDSEVDTVFLDPADLSQRAGFYAPGDVVLCVECGRSLKAEALWAALRAESDTEAWQVSREALLNSAWAWALKEDNRA